jgi:hypothetical protein
MQRWEYGELSTLRRDQTHTLKFYTPKGVLEKQVKREEAKGDGTDSDARNRYITELGIDGWELVNVAVDAEYLRMYFKRPLQ